jgi:PIN domain nuclease of toxin-antitoxin system
MLTPVADTHAVVWYIYRDRRLSLAAIEFLSGAVAAGDKVGMSAITLAEIVYLQERSRIPTGTFGRLTTAARDPRSVLREVPFDCQVAEALLQVSRSEVPEMPDRIIAATALHLGVPLITRDRRIRASGVTTIW